MLIASGVPVTPAGIRFCGLYYCALQFFDVLKIIVLVWHPLTYYKWTIDARMATLNT